MENPRPIGDLTVSALVATLASDAPVPGSGVAGAVALALGAACAAKALRITRRHAPDLPAAADADAFAATGHAALEQGQEDARHFLALIEARQSSHHEGQDPAVHHEAVGRANAAIATVAARLIDLCDEASARLDAVTGQVDAVVAGDILAARALIAAARTIHAANLDEALHRKD